MNIKFTTFEEKYIDSKISNLNRFDLWQDLTFLGIFESECNSNDKLKDAERTIMERQIKKLKKIIIEKIRKIDTEDNKIAEKKFNDIKKSFYWFLVFLILCFSFFNYLKKENI